MPDLPERCRVAYVGNFKRYYSTENHVKTAFESHGHVVTASQEGDATDHSLLLKSIATGEYDLILWTRTGEYGNLGPYEQWRVITAARKQSVPIVSYHLDRWWGLARQNELLEQPYFRTDLVITPDGAHNDMWEQIGINHAWLNPAVTLAETGRGSFRQEWACDVGFVGSYRAYHKEWNHRMQLIDYLRRVYRAKVRFFPEGGVPIRGADLADLYASIKIVVGDSCLAPGYGGRPMTHYTSDRIPETVGRGGFLIHPAVEGVTDGSVYTTGEHLATWNAGEFGILKNSIERLLLDPDKRERISETGMQHVIKNHTYEVRVQQILDLVKQRL